MQIDITGHHVEVTASLRSYVEEKLERIYKRSDKITDTHVILSVEKLVQKAEATLQLKGNKLFADAKNEDMYAAIDALADKLDRQVVKYKEKTKDHRGRKPEVINDEDDI